MNDKSPQIPNAPLGASSVDGTGPVEEWALEDAGLHGEDAAALDALVEAGFEPEQVNDQLRQRAERILRVLGVIRAPEVSGDAEARVDATLARIRAERDRAVFADDELSPNDDDALEALVGAGMAPEATPSPLRRRAARHHELLSLLEPTAAEVAGDGRLVERTLARVQEAIDRQESRMALERAPVGGRRLRIGDLITVAAVLAIGTAAVGPMVGAVREQARRTACAAGLADAGRGFASYAADFKDSMPLASASVAGNPWWFVGRPEQSNSANMYTLTRTGYTPVQSLACDGNAGACRMDLGPTAMDWRALGEVSYSFQNLFARERPTWSGRKGTAVPSQRLVLVDASPVVRRAVNGLWINPLANSTNHGEKGQNALFGDGNVRWLRGPVLESGDNIWLPRFLEEALAKHRQATQAEPIKGNETPAGLDDVFVGP